MEFGKTWIIIILVSVGLFYLGRYENSHLFIFIGIIGIVAGGTCELSSLIMQFIKKHDRH